MTTWVLLIVAGLLLWVGLTLLLDAWMDRRRPQRLADHLERYMVSTAAEEAQEWLRAARGTREPNEWVARIG